MLSKLYYFCITDKTTIKNEVFKLVIWKLHILSKKKMQNGTYAIISTVKKKSSK